MSEPNKAYYDGLIERIGSGIVGRGMYEAAGAWGGKNPFPGTLVVLTHRAADPHDESFVFVDDLGEALRLAREAAGDKAVSIGGGGHGVPPGPPPRGGGRLWLPPPPGGPPVGRR